MLDEPTVGLDPVLRRDLWELFRRLAEGGRSLLVSSHVMDEATRCDRLLLLREGRVLADDDARRSCSPGPAPPTPSRRLPRPHRPRRGGQRDERPRCTLATAGRVLRQVRADHRTVALMLVVPCVLIGLLAWIYNGTHVFDHIGAAAARASSRSS